MAEAKTELPVHPGPAGTSKPADSYLIDAEKGADNESADGSLEKPFQTVTYAYIQTIDKPEKPYLVRDPKTNEWIEPTKSAVKKAVGARDVYKKKQEKQRAQEALNKKQREEALAQAKTVKLVEDTSLPAPKKITIADKKVELGQGETKGQRVKVCGRIHRLRAQKQATFITLVDGYGQLQCVLQAGPLTKNYDALLFAQGTSLEMYGEMKKVPEGQHAPDGRELLVDYYKVLGHSPSEADAITNRVSSTQDPWEASMLDSRHLVLRGEQASAVMKIRSAIEVAFISTYHEMKFTKVSPPALGLTEAEGGSSLFTVPYYGEDAYLTQSSQLYLETCIPSMGNVYCIEKSFRAEKSLTRRHLSEYTHVEAELDYIDFSDLLDHMEELLCTVVEKLLADTEIAAYIKLLNPDFKPPARPFLRMKYSDAIDWLNAQNPPILNEEDKPHTFGDDIAEAAERKMTDIINKPIFLTHFPADLKAFYMKKDADDKRITESVDLLMPGVGEIVGASMRIDDYDELMAAYVKQGIDSKDYYWYSDQRKYGTSPHGGYGLGLERFLAWIANQHSVRTCCLYPRFMGRCKP